MSDFFNNKIVAVTGGSEGIGKAFGTIARLEGETSVSVGRDGRLSGPSLVAALIRGLAAAGLSPANANDASNGGKPVGRAPNQDGRPPEIAPPFPIHRHAD